MNDSSLYFPPHSERNDQNAPSPALEPAPFDEDYNRINSREHQGYHLYYGSRSTSGSGSDQRHNKVNRVYHTQSHGQSVGKVEEHELQNQQQIHHELQCLYQEPDELSSHAFKAKHLPNLIISLAQKLLPTVVQRLCHHDDHRRMLEWDDHNGDFEGHCTPLGNSSTEDVRVPNESMKLKTTGLGDDKLHTSIQDEEGHLIQHQRKISDLEMGDPSEYLPQSAALLISALQNSARKEHKKIDGKSSSREDLSTFVEEAVKETDGNPREGFTSTANIENFEQEAEALLESIRGDDRRREDSSTNISSNLNIRYASSSFDDDDSIGGDMVRLSRSIAFLQHDLANVDLTHFDQHDGFGEVSDHNTFEVEGTAWSRMKMWFSRGMIMEQKLLNSYIRMGDDSYGSSMDTTTNNRYVDNPVLIWSLAIMWAFVLLVMGHSQISEWAEGEDPGILADIVEWLFS
ncbi:hypothetical protein ACHAW6_003651 [Cyclotella cf. meneghiniana]